MIPVTNLHKLTLSLQQAVLSLQVIDVLLVGVVLSSHKLNVLGCLLKDLSAACLKEVELTS